MSKRSNVTPTSDPQRNSLISNPTVPDSSNSDIGETGAPDERGAKGDGPMPDEITGRASGTGEDLVSLFADGSAEHLSDGFAKGNGDDPEADPETADEPTEH